MKPSELARWARRQSPARRKALDVMRRSHPRPARISNVTSYATSTLSATVYWQTARWLVDQKLAVESEHRVQLELTPLGLDIAHKAASS